MTNYPTSLDDDTTIYRIDDNVTEIDGTTINQERDAIFALESTVGINPQGTKDSLADRINVSINPDGYLRSSAVQAVGLVSLPITDNQVGTNAGIKESKLDLNHSTNDLYALEQNTIAIVNGVEISVATLQSNLTEHANGVSQRHKASNIDLDTAITTGSTSNLNVGVHAIDSEFQTHKNTATLAAHIGHNISLDTSDFVEIPQTATNVQDAINALDNMDAIALGTHRATMHGNGVPRTAKSTTLIDGYLVDPNDGYSENYGTIVVPSSLVTAYLANTTLNANPKDSFADGDDIVDFSPSLGSVLFQTQFAQVKVGDWIYINYGTGISARYIIDSLFFDVANSVAKVRINGTNLIQSTTAKAIIFKKRYDDNTHGVLAVAPVNTSLSVSQGFVSGSVIVADPRGACALGTFFDPNQLDSTHFNLYLQIYFQGAPSADFASYKILPAIDVTGNQGSTPGAYTLENIVEATNNAMHVAGFNYRMIAFAKDGKFGIMMADVIDNASFSIITSNPGNNQSSANASYPNNVIDIYTPKDALGLGPTHANLASPAYVGAPTNYSVGTALLLTPQNKRMFVTNGAQFDRLVPAPFANTDGYFYATVSAPPTIVGSSTEVQYRIIGDLTNVGFKPGMTIVVAPMSYSNFNYMNYGRFIIKEVFYAPACTIPSDDPAVLLTVVNGIHSATATTIPSPDIFELPVRIYFGNDSVGFDKSQIIDDSSNQTLHRLYEIYVTDKQTTFAHERARLVRPRSLSNIPVQPLVVEDWHIRYVSPKFRGTLTSIPVTAGYSEWSCFFIRDYDVTSGEFTAQLSAPDNTTALLGPPVRAKKNVPFKLYSYNGPDYIELEYVETSGAATPIDSTLFSNFQLFPSLADDEEVFQLASCEVNWQQGGQFVVDRVVDRRQFGNTNERDFTNSAKDFITSVTRYNVANGVIRGFEASYSGAYILLQGGSGVVDGSVVNANNSQVYIPIISGSTPAISQFILCLDNLGNYECLPMTTSKIQLFASGRYRDSVTFSEVMDSRKYLLPLYIINTTGAVITSIADVRKYSANDYTGFVMSSDGYSQFGTVRTWDAALNLFTYYNGFTELGIVGNVWAMNVGATNLTLAGGGSGKHLVINGYGSGKLLCTTEVASIAVGYLIGDLTFKGLTFISSKYQTTDTLGVDTGGVIVYNASSRSSSINIENCVFTSTANVSIFIPPYINIWSPNALLSRVNISDNEFTRAGTANVASFAAIAISTSGSASDLTTIDSVTIKNNKSYSLKGHCVIGGRKNTSPMQTTDSWIVINNLVIDNNNFSVINASCGKDSNIHITNNIADVISNNICLLVIPAFGKYLYGAFGSGSYLDIYDNGTGSITVEKNTASVIDIVNISIVTGTLPTASPAVYGVYPYVQLSSAKIINNTLKNNASSGTIQAFFGASLITKAISCMGSYSVTSGTRSVTGICDGNIILKTSNDNSSSGNYIVGIYSSNFTVTNNSIYGFSSIGIESSVHADSAYDGAGYDLSTVGKISGNTIVRDDMQTIGAFIKLYHGSNVGYILSGTMCVDNMLSHRTVNRTDPLAWQVGDSETILNYCEYDVIERNKNHVITATVPVSNFSSSSYQVGSLIGYDINYGYSEARLLLSGTPSSETAHYLIFDSSAIPEHVSLIRVAGAVNVVQAAYTGTVAHLQFTTSSLQQDPVGANLSITGIKAISWYPTQFQVKNNFRNFRLYIPSVATNGSSVLELNGMSFLVNYCY